MSKEIRNELVGLPVKIQITSSKFYSFCHCEERSDKAISILRLFLNDKLELVIIITIDYFLFL